MNPRANNYIRDIHSYVENIPFGDVDIQVKRVNRKTVLVTTVAEETLRYVNNTEAQQDIMNLIQKLIDASFSGEAHIKLLMKDGQIQLVGIFDKKQTTY